MIDDLVQGPVTVSNAEIDDFVLLRSDGTPTYMLAVVVDGLAHAFEPPEKVTPAILDAVDWVLRQPA